MSDTALILHVKGTTEETTTLPTQAVRAAIAEGKLSRSQLIWSVPHNAWKQVRELPHLWPSQKLAPAPTPRLATGNLPRVATGDLPRISGANPKPAASQPKVKVSAKQPKAVNPSQATSQSYHVSEKAHFNPFKWICIVLGTLIVGVLGFNYFLVDQPISSALGQTPYAKVSVYAHLGGFMQPDALQIHVLGSGALSKSNVVDFMVALAQSTPQTTHVFKRISLSSGLQAQYTISGFAWNELGSMKQADESERKEFLLAQLADAYGQPLLNLNSAMTVDQQNAEREKVWETFLAYFSQP